MAKLHVHICILCKEKHGTSGQYAHSDPVCARGNKNRLCIECREAKCREIAEKNGIEAARFARQGDDVLAGAWARNAASAAKYLLS